jgi:hypothetical protein
MAVALASDTLGVRSIILDGRFVQDLVKAGTAYVQEEVTVNGTS